MESFCRVRGAGYLAILCAVMLRISDSGLPARLIPRTTPIETKTGQDVRSFEFYPMESPPPEPPVFDESDLDSIRITGFTGTRQELAELLTAEFSADSVLILHTHATESYTPTPGEEYEPSGEYRTLDEAHNMLAVGFRAAQVLEAEGIAVTQERSLHDYPSYTAAYSHARKAIRSALEEEPGLVLDLHRDASGGSRQLRTEAAVDGQSAAQIMIVLGTGSGGLGNDRWRENLSIALKLAVLLERRAPGITRSIQLRPQRFNQDLAPSLLLEIGAAGNTLPEAIRTAEAAAKAIAELVGGS